MSDISLFGVGQLHLGVGFRNLLVRENLGALVQVVWLALIFSGVITAMLTGKMADVTKATIDAAKTSVELCIGLIGIMALWLGFMRLAEKAGLVQGLSRLMKPILRRLFPDVPADHPAMGSMLSNLAANMLGLGNSATALGLKAMQDLKSLSKHTETATNAMATFLAMNSASITLIPATVIAMRASAGSQNATGIIGPTLLATIISMAASIITVKLLEKTKWFKLEEPKE
ncbi:MAG: nucleoside recognition protein [bacterium]|nr:nucleoside recognition protein [bacterium]